MKAIQKAAAAVCAVMMMAGVSGISSAAGLGTVDVAALMQQHPDFAKTMASWQEDLNKTQKEYQKEGKDAKDQQARIALAQKYNVKLNKQRIALFSPIEKDILQKTEEVKQEKQLDYVVIKGAVILGESEDITDAVAAKLKK